ncbi:MAG: hypothetical protein AAB434_02055, partial [Planctomycetota bacterium]
MASPRIESLLAEVKSRVRRTEVKASLVLLAVLAIAFFVVEAVVDRVLLLDRWVRFALFAGFGTFALMYLSVPLYLGLKRIRSLYAARLIEERHPEMKEGLTTLLQAEEGKAIGAKALVGPLRQSVEKSVGPLDPERHADGSLLRWSLIGLALAGVFAGAGFAAGGSAFARCLARCVNPFRELLPPTRTVIARVEPGDTTVLRGKPVPVAAEIRGEAVDEARLYFSEDGATWLVMGLQAEGNGRFSGVLPSVRNDTRYFVLAGDTKSDVYALTPQDPPDVAEVAVSLVFPEYSGLGEREVDGGDIDALVGTKATIRVKSGSPLAEAWLRMEDGALVKMDAKGTSARTSLTVQKSTSYSVLLVAENETRNENPPVYTVIARRDQPPAVRVSKPGRDVEVPADETLPIAIAATDDCGVEQLSMVYQVKGGRAGRKPIRLGQERRNVVLETGLIPSTMGLKAGDVLLYYVEAHDGLKPRANRAVSPLYVIRVKQPEGAQAVKPPTKQDEEEFRDRISEEDEAKLAKVERLLKQLKKPEKKEGEDEAGENDPDRDKRQADTLPRRGEEEEAEDADAEGQEEAEEDPYDT